jgi:hypothetical protein
MIFRVRTMTLPGQALLVDLRPVFRKPLADVTPQLPARFPKMLRRKRQQAAGTAFRILYTHTRSC